MIDYFIQSLNEFAPKQTKNFVEITLPVVTQINGGLLDLRITPTQSGYKICCPNDLFLQANRKQEWYFNLFMQNETNYHFEMRLENGFVVKTYEKEFNIVVAVSEFVHFFVLFDSYIINNAIIGNEEKFES